MTISFSMLGKFSTIISSKNFSYPFFFSSVEGINSRISEEEERISELEDKMVEITFEEQNKVKRMKRTEDNSRDLWDHVKCTNVQIIGIPEEEEKNKVHEKIIEYIVVEKFPNIGKERVNQVQEA